MAARSDRLRHRGIPCALGAASQPYKRAGPARSSEGGTLVLASLKGASAYQALHGDLRLSLPVAYLREAAIPVACGAAVGWRSHRADAGQGAGSARQPAPWRGWWRSFSRWVGSRSFAAITVRSARMRSAPRAA